jgi:hypothetical protein
MIYVYAFLPAADLARSPDAPPEPVRFLAHGDLVVAAAEVGSAPAPELDALRRHDTAVRAAAAGAAAVLPARFGSIFGTETELLRWLEPRRPRILEALRQVQGCEQMTLRAFSGPATAPARPAPEGDGRADEPAPLGAGAGPGTRYLAEKRRARAGGTSPDVEALRRALEPLVCGERLERHDAPPLLATLHHLVRRGQTADYRAAVERAQEALAALRIAATGPWPPYAFVPEGLS